MLNPISYTCNAVTNQRNTLLDYPAKKIFDPREELNLTSVIDYINFTVLAYISLAIANQQN